MLLGKAGQPGAPKTKALYRLRSIQGGDGREGSSFAC